MLNPKTSTKILLYGIEWEKSYDPVKREMKCIRMGGKWVRKSGEEVGNGLEFHFRKFQEYIYGDAKHWHKWNILQLECFLKYRTIAVMGPKSSGKTNSAATDALADYFIWPECTTVLCCSTTRERLEDRVWGEIKKYFDIAKQKYEWLPGHLIEGRQRIVSSSRQENSFGRDFRNGLIGLACRRGNEMVNIGDFAGIKNKRVRVLADELSHFERPFIDIISNLDANPDFKFYGLGNPKDTIDALGIIAEPSAEKGGWESNIDQAFGTKTWPIKRPQGICIQLDGEDSPNLDGSLKIPLITQEMIDRDVAFYGKNSIQYTMMNRGMMPKGQGARRVITRQECEKFGATNEPFWKDSNRTRIAFLDAAYRGVGGDRCIFGELQFGKESEPLTPETLITNLISQPANAPKGREIIALIDLVNVPITADDTPEDQIVRFVRELCIARGIPPANFFYDAGMRTSLVQSFSRLWSVEVNSIDFGGKASDTPVSTEIKALCCDYYSKFVTELWFTFRLCVQSRQFRGLTQEVMWEFAAREWKVTNGNKIEVETKADMKIKTGKSPDLADAVAVGIFGARKRGFVIEKLQPPAEYKPHGKDWRSEAKKKADIWKSGQLSTTK